jgi:hypothetical protein
MDKNIVFNGAQPGASNKVSNHPLDIRQTADLSSSNAILVFSDGFSTK